MTLTSEIVRIHEVFVDDVFIGEIFKDENDKYYPNVEKLISKKLRISLSQLSNRNINIRITPTGIKTIFKITNDFI